MDNKFVSTTKYIVKALVEKNYEKLELFTKGIFLSKENIEGAINEYGDVVVSPPEESYQELDIIEVKNGIPKKWSVRFDLWSKKEGKSDLSLEATFIDNDEELFFVEIDGIHVL